MSKSVSLAAIFFAALFLFKITACSSDQVDGNSPNSKNLVAPSKPDGLAVFRQKCVNCHGNDGKLGLNGAKDLALSQLSLDERILVITNGRNLMTPWKGLLTPEEIKAVAELTQTLK